MGNKSRESNISKQNYSQYVCLTEPSQSGLGFTQESQKARDRNTIDMSEMGNTFEVERQFEDEADDTNQTCEQIEEVSDESLQASIVDLNGERVGPHSFEPLSLIGQGSFGEVYLVMKKDSRQSLYAMKILQKKKIMAQNLIKYAVTERNVLSITKHPFIVGLNYAFQTKDKLFLILDYCPGGDLGKALG